MNKIAQSDRFINKLSQVEIKSKLRLLLKSSILILSQKPSKYKIVLVRQGWVLKGISSNWDDLIYIELSFFKIKFLTSPRSLKFLKLWMAARNILPMAAKQNL